VILQFSAAQTIEIAYFNHISIFSKILSIVGSSNSIISAFSIKNFKYCRKLKTATPDIFLKTCRGKNEKSIFEISTGVNK
jgi:hypothetical protein